MRKIKFRAYNVLTKKWEYYTLQDLIDGGARGVALDDWQQFTGLKDKEGKEIYEGDIINKAQPYEVVFFKGGFYIHGFSKKRKEFWQSLDNFVDEDDNTNTKLFKYEIIGNIYEHKHLFNN